MALIIIGVVIPWQCSMNDELVQISGDGPLAIGQFRVSRNTDIHQLTSQVTIERLVVGGHFAVYLGGDFGGGVV